MARYKPPVSDMTGMHFGRLLVMGMVPKNEWKTHQAHWHCKCVCGQERVVCGGDLRNGHTRSCGCWMTEVRRKQQGPSNRNFKHGAFIGGKRTSTSVSFQAMHARCERPANDNFHLYGAIGVRVCKRWSGARGFENFLADMGERPIGMTLDRKFNGKVYCKRECRWSTPKEQANNRRKSGVANSLAKAA